VISLFSLALVNFATFLGGIGSLLLKIGSDKFVFDLKKILLNKPLVFGLLIYVLSTFLFVPALHNANLSVVYPFVSMSYFWAMFFSFVFLKERISLRKIVAVLFIVGGVIIIGL